MKYTWGLDRNATYVYAGQEITYDDVGNIHYGYVGSAIGNPLNLLLDAAGAYQKISGTSSPEYDLAARGDDPADQQAVIFGYMLKNNPSFDPSTTKIRDIDYAANYDRW